jgi:hypothetical protein
MYQPIVAHGVYIQLCMLRLCRVAAAAAAAAARQNTHVHAVAAPAIQQQQLLTKC